MGMFVHSREFRTTRRSGSIAVTLVKPSCSVSLSYRMSSRKTPLEVSSVLEQQTTVNDNADEDLLTESFEEAEVKLVAALT